MPLEIKILDYGDIELESSFLVLGRDCGRTRRVLTLGFLITMSLLVFTLLTVVERRNVLIAAAYSVGLTLFAYWLFGKALKAPLERGLLWF